ncbi:MAG TPA: hypothetical protein VN132_13320 [Bdellovibrio sp.]|nr:hypothetical protein [Bdellovibrio sp.]
MSSLEKEIWARHFRQFRILLGVYLVYHFMDLLPWAQELFGLNGALSSPSLNGTYKVFPDLIFLFNSSSVGLTVFIASLIVASFGLIFDRFTSLCALWLWYGWACLFNANNLILNPSLSYIGWILLATAVISWRPQTYKKLFQYAWILLGVGYFVSGWVKAQSPSWQDGSALWHVLNNPLARDNAFHDWLLTGPRSLYAAMTWFVLFLELAFLPLSLWHSARPWVWLLMTALHIGILATVGFADLTLGMLITHLFVWDPQWELAKLFSWLAVKSKSTEPLTSA